MFVGKLKTAQNGSPNLPGVGRCAVRQGTDSRLRRWGPEGVGEAGGRAESRDARPAGGAVGGVPDHLEVPPHEMEARDGARPSGDVRQGQGKGGGRMRACGACVRGLVSEWGGGIRKKTMVFSGAGGCFSLCNPC